jgi:hypothetical protein
VLPALRRRRFGYLGYDEVSRGGRNAASLLGTCPNDWDTGRCAVLLYHSRTVVDHAALFEINPTSGFPTRFSSRGVEWAAQVAAVGRSRDLPVVVLIGLVATWLAMSMADGCCYSLQILIQ